MNTILAIGRNPLVRIFALLVILYSFGVPIPPLGRNPCAARGYTAAVYVLTPGGEMCYVAGSGWVELP